MLLYFAMTETFGRAINPGHLESINGAIEDLACTKGYFRPVYLGDERLLPVMPAQSLENIFIALRSGVNQAAFGAAFNTAPSNKPINSTVEEIRFPGARHSPNYAETAILNEAAAEGISKKGMRKIMLHLATEPDQFYPKAAQEAAESLGATKSHERPVPLTIGWLDLATESSVMQARREEISAAVLQAAPVIELGPIVVGQIS